jgi:hypothetical protein
MNLVGVITYPFSPEKLCFREIILKKLFKEYIYIYVLIHFICEKIIIKRIKPWTFGLKDGILTISSHCFLENIV